MRDVFMLCFVKDVYIHILIVRITYNDSHIHINATAVTVIVLQEYRPVFATNIGHFIEH